MKLVHDRADARWLPSRFRFAVFRVVAWMKFRASQPERREGLVLAIDRDQTALESYAVTVWLVAHWACFVLAWLEAFLPWAAAAVLAVVVGIFIPQAIVVGGGLGPSHWRQQNHVEMNSFLQLFFPTVVALWLAGEDGWERFPAWSFLATLLLNACAAVVIRLLPEPEIEIA